MVAKKWWRLLPPLIKVMATGHRRDNTKVMPMVRKAQKICCKAKTACCFSANANSVLTLITLQAYVTYMGLRAIDWCTT